MSRVRPGNLRSIEFESEMRERIWIRDQQQTCTAELQDDDVDDIYGDDADAHAPKFVDDNVDEWYRCLYD